MRVRTMLCVSCVVGGIHVLPPSSTSPPSWRVRARVAGPGVCLGFGRGVCVENVDRRTEVPGTSRPALPPKTTHGPFGPRHLANIMIHARRAPATLKCASTSSPSGASSALGDTAEQPSGPASHCGAASRGSSPPPSQRAATIITDEELCDARAALHLPHGDGTPEAQAGLVLHNVAHPTGRNQDEKTGKV